MARLIVRNVPEALYRELLNRARAQRRSVAQEVVHILQKELRSQPGKRHSLLELRGLGKHIWKGIDAAEYVRRERDSWD